MQTFKTMVVRTGAFLAAILTVLAFCAVQQGRAEEYSKPSSKANAGGGSGNSSGAGTVTPDLFTGTMSYSIPIEVPAGRKGMAPALALTYRNNNGNGWIGVGWELEAGSVERSMKNGVDTSGEDYVLRIAGGTMDLVSIGNGQYQAKIEDAFYRIEKISGANGDYWEVKDRAGKLYLFGEELSQRQTDPADNTRVFRWCLNKVVDAGGNFMTFQYTKDHGVIYLDRIDYTGNDDSTPAQAATNYVLFTLEDRDDAPWMYNLGHGSGTMKRLKEIEVRADSQLQRKYVLEYDADPATGGAQYSSSTGRSVLSKVTQYDKNGSPTVTPQTMSYDQGVNVYQSGIWSTELTSDLWVEGQFLSGYFQDVYQGDFDGDGKADLMLLNGAYAKVFLPSENGFEGSIWIEDGFVQFSPHDLENAYPGDFDGDGKTDFMVYDNLFGVRVYLSTGSSFVRDEGFGSITSGNHGIYTGDFNGDGKTDLMVHNSSTQALEIYLSTGSGFLGAGTWASSPLSQQLYLGDFNGDGKTDFMRYRASGQGVVVGIADPDGSRFIDREWSTVGECDTKVGDFNGDGNADFVQFTPNGLKVFLAKPEEEAFFYSFWDPATGAMLTYQTGDFNGDGKTDLVRHGWDVITVFLSSGSDFSVANWAGSMNYYCQTFVGDYDGDGIMDVAQLWPEGTNVFLSKAEPDLLSSIGNGTGGTVAVEYGSSTAYSNILLPFPVRVVSSVTTSDGRGLVSTTTYSYEGGYYHIGEKDFRGFNHVKVSGPTGPNSEQAVTETWFYQGDMVSVIAEDATFETLSSYASATVGFMKGKVYRTKTTDEAGAEYSKTLTRYVEPPEGSSDFYFTPPEKIRSYVCDGDGSCGLSSRTTLSYDDWGNVKQEEFYLDADESEPLYRKTERSYYYPESGNFVSLLQRETVYDGSSNRKAETTYSYVDDNAASWCPGAENQTVENGHVTRIIRWLGEAGVDDPEVWMAYDDYGNLLCTRDAKGYTTTITYDEDTFTVPRGATNPLGHQAETKYYGIDGELADDGLYGQVKSVTTGATPYLSTVSYKYDTFGRKKEVLNPDGTWTRWAYNNFGTVGSQHVRTTTSAGPWSETYFDGLGRTYLARKTGPGSTVIATETDYNATGTVARTSLPYFDGTETPRWTSFTYDSVGRTKQTDNPDGSSVKTCYDDGVAVVIDSEGHRKRQTSDVRGKVVKIEEYDGTFASCSTESGSPYATTTYESDVMGNLTFVHDAAGIQTEIRYDHLGRKRYMDDPDMGVWTYTYDANGNIETQTDAKGKIITFQYDELNRVTLKDYETGTDVVFTYDEPASTYGLGRLTTMTDATGTTTYFYDNMGRTTKTTRTIDSTDYTTVTGYHAQTGRLQRIKYPGEAQASVWYEYNEAGGLSVVRSGPTATAAAYATYGGYNALGQPETVTYGNGVTTTYSYEQDSSRLSSIVTTTGGQPMIDLEYTFWDDGNIKSIIDGVKSFRSATQINYDGLNRMIQVETAGPAGTLTYTYNEVGNILSKEGVGYTQYANNAGPHAVTMLSTGQTFTYDANGNMTADGTRTIAYNYDNMPKSVTVSGETATFYYDGDGARVVKTAPSSGTTVYIGKMQECKAGGGCTNYIFAGGTRIASRSGSDIYYYHQDHLGSTRIVTDGTGEVVEDIMYYPFGSAESDTGGVSVGHKYTSQEYDPETGLYYYNARYYNPALGRFISPDTIVPSPMNPQAFNRYSYVVNNPIYYSDPSGNSPRDWVKRQVGKLRNDSSLNMAGWILSPYNMMLIDSATSGKVANYAYEGVDKALRYTMFDYTWKTLDRDSYDRYGRTVRSIEFAMMMSALGVPAPIVGGASGGVVAAIHGGNIPQGILVGSISGVIPSVAPFGSGPWASFGNQIVTDAIRGGVTGGVAAAMNGGDVYSGLVRGAATAAIAGQFNNAIGHALGFATSWSAPRYDETHGVFVYEGLSRGSIVFGNVIVGDNASILGHEYIHTVQYENWGIAFLAAYVAQFPAAILTGNNPFYYNFFEWDARQQSGQGY